MLVRMMSEFGCQSNMELTVDALILSHNHTEDVAKPEEMENAADPVQEVSKRRVRRRLHRRHTLNCVTLGCGAAGQ